MAPPRSDCLLLVPRDGTDARRSIVARLMPRGDRRALVFTALAVVLLASGYVADAPDELFSGILFAVLVLVLGTGYLVGANRTSDRRVYAVLEELRAKAIELDQVNRRLLEDAQQRSHELVQLLDVSQVLAATPERHSLLTVLFGHLRELAPFEFGAFYTADLAAWELGFTVASFDDGLGTPIDRIPIGEGPIGVVARDGTPIVLAAEPNAPIRVSGLPELEQLVAVPIASQRGLQGVLALGRTSPMPFGAQDLRLLYIVAEHLGACLERAELYERVKEESVRDGMTQVYNHEYLLRRLEEEVARSRRSGEPLSYIMLDVDDFKQVNDRYGHLAGDDVLRAVAAKVHKFVRKFDVVGRYGGEEFGIILPGTDLPRAALVAERIRQIVADRPIRLSAPEIEIHVTISLGAAALPDDGGSPDELLRVADRYLYRAKATGKNKVCATVPLVG